MASVASGICVVDVADGDRVAVVQLVVAIETLLVRSCWLLCLL